MAIIEPWTKELGPERAFVDYEIYSYEWIDRMTYFEDAEEALNEWSLKDAFLNHFRHRFAESGWDGHGTLQILWVPPFAGVNAPTHGFFLLHVKQKADGVSWIASRYPVIGLREE